MLQKPFHGIPKLPAVGAPSPRFNLVPESPSRLTPLDSHSPLPPLFYCRKNLPRTSHFRITHQTTIFPLLSTTSFATGPPSTAAHYSCAPEPNHITTEDQVEGEGSGGKKRYQICPGDVVTLESPKRKRKLNPKRKRKRKLNPKRKWKRKLNPKHFPLLMWWIKLSPWQKAKRIVSALLYAERTPQDVVDRFYQEMSKEVETIFHEGDQRTLPEELSRRVVVTCVSGDGTCDVFMLRTKQRSQESCREIEVESVTTYVRPQVINMQFPGHPLQRLRLKRNYKVVNKLEVSPERYAHVAFEEAMKYGGKVIPGSPEQVTLLRTTWAMQLWEKTKLIVANLLKQKDLLFFLCCWLLETWAMRLWKKTKLIVAKLVYAK